jgi:MscS family membrane protein
MKIRFESLFRLYIGTLVVLLAWSVWSADSSSATNAPHTLAGVTNATPGGSLPVLPSINTKEMFQALTGLDDDQLTFGLRNIPWLRNVKLLGEPLWKYIASALYIFLAFYVAKFLDYLTNAILKRWASRTETKFDDLLLELLHGPVKVVGFVILLHVGLNLIRWPGWVERFLSNGLKIAVALSLTYLVIKLVDLLLGVWEQRSANKKDEQFHLQLFPIIRKSIKAFVVVVSFLITAPHLGLNITGLIASLSIGGLAIGLAAQDTLANLFGAVAVLVDKPFHVGDRIQIESVDGIVETIGFRCTRVRNLDGHLVSLPNKLVGSATITNITQRPNIRTIINVGITYSTGRAGIERALGLLTEIFKNHPRTADAWISFNRFADSSLNLQVIHWWKGEDYKVYLADIQAMNLDVKERFDAAGLAMAFPTQTLYLRQEKGWELPPGATPAVPPIT